MMSLDHFYYMSMALSEGARAFEEGEVPVGAVVVSGDKVIARAFNLTERLKDVTAHAEIQAITAAANYLGGKYLRGCTMYVTLEPCLMCAGALYHSQISGLVYAAADPKKGYTACGVKLHPMTTIISGILAKESESLLKAFFADKRKRNNRLE